MFCFDRMKDDSENGEENRKQHHRNLVQEVSPGRFVRIFAQNSGFFVRIRSFIGLASLVQDQSVNQQRHENKPKHVKYKSNWFPDFVKKPEYLRDTWQQPCLNIIHSRWHGHSVDNAHENVDKDEECSD